MSTVSMAMEAELELFQAARKRARTAAASDPVTVTAVTVKPQGHFGTDVRSAYQYLRRLCQQSRLVQERTLVPVVWRHQLEPLANNIDRELEVMVQEGQIRILSHGSSSRENDAIVWLDDYVARLPGRPNMFVDLFLSRVVRPHPETEYSDGQLRARGFGPDAVQRLIGLGLLTNTDLDRRQLSFPGLGSLVKALYEGRQSLLQLVRRAKYSQMLQSEILGRRRDSLKRTQALGLEFHLYDLYGKAGLVRRHSANIQGDCLVQAID